MKCVTFLFNLFCDILGSVVAVVMPAEGVMKTAEHLLCETYSRVLEL